MFLNIIGNILGFGKKYKKYNLFGTELKESSKFKFGMYVIRLKEKGLGLDKERLSGSRGHRLHQGKVDIMCTTRSHH